MRFSKYINEEFFEDELEIIKIIESRCQPALKEMKQKKLIFWRGLKGQTHEDYIIKNIRQVRHPKDMPPIVQRWIDDLFQKKFGWKPRATGVFASVEFRGSHFPHYMFFPIGNYSYLWSTKVRDLYIKLRFDLPFDIDELRYGDLSKKDIKITKTLINNYVKTYTNKNIKYASKNEVMFNIPSKKYLAVNEQYREAITKYLKE
jgi:hypothetical protein